jgi:hypothetical protein
VNRDKQRYGTADAAGKDVNEIECLAEGGHVRDAPFDCIVFIGKDLATR